LAAQHPTHIVVECDDAPQAIFENGAWTRTLPQMVVFDDVFVDDNVYSGLAVDSAHRQRMHELVLGAAGVTLNRQLQDLVQRIEAHNANLRNLSAAIPATTRHRTQSMRSATLRRDRISMTPSLRPNANMRRRVNRMPFVRPMPAVPTSGMVPPIALHRNISRGFKQTRLTNCDMESSC
jgi:hypothetical protein